MLDRFMRPLIDPPLNRLGRRLSAAGFTANQVTLAGAAVGLLAALLVAFGAFLPALILLLLGRLADGLDGAIARHQGKTDFGGYLDITMDFLIYGAIPAGFVAYDPAGNGLAGALLLTAFYVNGASFLGFAILAEKRKMETTAQGEKTLFYSNGLLEGTETILFFAVILIFPTAFAPLALAFAALTVTTTALRLKAAYEIFR
ncbi:CDP-alcohol phosphatidyltransferase family protein [Paracoccaceae bacterium GXU_MW_L88]